MATSIFNWKKSVITLAIALAATTGAQAQITWNGAVNYTTTQTITQTINVSGAATVNISAGVTVTVSGVISGSAALTVRGGGKLILTGANTYSGAITITGSALQIGNGTSGSIVNISTVKLSDGYSILRFEPGADMIFDKVISGFGKVEYKGVGLLIFTADNTYTGTTTIEAGTLALGDNLNAAGTGNVAGNIVNYGNLAFDQSNDFTVVGDISGTGTVYKSNTPTKVTLTGNNTYTGLTTVHNGTLQIGNGTSGTLTASDVQINSTATLRFEPGTNMTFDKVISGSGKVEFNGSNGRLTFTADNTYTGITTIETGTLALGFFLNTAGTGNVAGNIVNYGNLTFDHSNDFTVVGDISGTGTVYKSTTPSKVTLTGNNTYTGLTTVDNGTLQIGNGTSGTLTASDVQINSTATLHFEPSRNTVFSKVISGLGKVEYKGKNGADLGFTADNSYSGTTTVEAGHFHIGENTATGSVAGNIIVNANANLDFHRSNDYTFSKVISGAGNVNKYRTNKITLTGANTYTGATTVNDAGILQIGDGNSGSIDSTANVNIGNANAILRFEPGANMNFGKVISGSGKVEYKGASGKSLVFTADNNYTGGTTVDDGTLQIGNGTSGSIANTSDVSLTKASSILRFEPGATVIFDKKISGNGKVEYKGKNGADMGFTADNAYIGTTTVEAGHFHIGENTATGSVAGNIIVAANANLDFHRSNDYIYSKVISGAGTVNKFRTNKITLTGANTYTGATTVNDAGILQIGDGNSGSIDSTANVNIGNANAILRFEPGKKMIFGKKISGNGKVEYKGTWGKDLSFTADNNYIGTTTVEEGFLWIGNNTATGSIAGDIILNDGTWLDFRRSTDYIYSGVISGAGNINRYNAGKVTLDGVNTFTGETRIQEGTLALGANGSIEYSSDVLFDSNTAKFDISAGNKTIKALNGDYSNSEVILGGSTLTIGQAGQTDNNGGFNGVFSGTGNVIKQGTGKFSIFNPANAATGIFTLKEGRLLLNGGNWAGNFIQNAGTDLEVVDAASIGGNLALNSGSIYMDLRYGLTPKLTVGGGVSTSGLTTFKIAADTAVNNYVLMEAASGITSATPYALDIPLMTGSFSVQSPTKLLLNAQIIPVCEIVGGVQYNSLDRALNAITDTTHTTIKLLDNITIDRMDFYDRNITFDLNGKDLIFDYIYLENSVVDYTGAGNFKCFSNIQTTDDGNSFRVIDVEVGSTLKLMSVEANYSGGTNNRVYGIYCSDSSTVIVNGDVKVTNSGYLARGIRVYDISTVIVNGSVTAADGGIYIGNSVGAGATTVKVSGDVNASNVYGVSVWGDAEVTIDGKINAAIYIYFNGNEYTAAQYITPTTKPGYLTYADSTSTVWVKETSSGIETITADELRIYPNPVKDYLRFTIYDLRINKIEILDLAGKTIVNLKSSIVNQINVANLPSGVYFLKLETDEGIVTKKFIKQ